MNARMRGPVRIVGAGLLGASIGARPARARHRRDPRRRVAVAPRDSPSTTAPAARRPRTTPRRSSSSRCRRMSTAVGRRRRARRVSRTRSSRMSRASRSGILAELATPGADVSRYLGSHPMAGRERGGAVSARADLFLGRPWVIARARRHHLPARRRHRRPRPRPRRDPVRMTPDEHDRGVALVSHVPQVVATLLAAPAASTQRRRARPRRAGAARHDPHRRQRPRAVGADPRRERRARSPRCCAPTATTSTASSPRSTTRPHPGARRTIAETLAGGNAGVARIPGKHGTDKRFTPARREGRRPAGRAGPAAHRDRRGGRQHGGPPPRALARRAGRASPRSPCSPRRQHRLANELAARGWRIAGRT